MTTPRRLMTLSMLALGFAIPPAFAEETFSTPPPEIIRPVPELFEAQAGHLSKAPQDPSPSVTPEAEITRATRQFQDTGKAPILHDSTVSRFPFGESQPLIQCSPLRACDIELQAGEVVRGVAIGDSDRWIAKPLESGDIEATVPHVIVKPKDYGIDTNLVIATTRRTYHLRLTSPELSAEGDAHGLDQRHVAFYYPQNLVAKWAGEEQIRQQQANRRSTTVTNELAVASLGELNFDYAVRNRHKVPWAPATVFDDGEHVYLKLPPSARSSDLPALLVEAEGGGFGVSNYRIQGSWYIVDGLFARARLVVGVGKHRRFVEILSRHTASSRGGRHER